MTAVDPREAWISTFYTSPNELDPDADDVTRDWVERVREGDASFALPISVRRSNGQSVLGLVCVGLDTAAARDLQEEINAFLDPTFTAVGGDGSHLPIGSIAALAPLANLPEEQRLPDTARAFRVVLGGDIELAQAQLRRLAHLRGRKPDLSGQAARPLGYLVRDLRAGLRRGEVSAAREACDEIAKTGLLGAINLVGIEILCLEAEEKWGDMLAAPELRDIARLPLARDVVTALLRGVYHVHVVPHISTAPSGLIEQFDRSVLLEAELGGLFRNAKWATTDEERTMWALFAAAQSPPDIRLVDNVAADVSEDSVLRHVLLGIRDALSGDATTGQGSQAGVAQAAQLISDGNYSSALVIVETLEEAEPQTLARLHVYCAAGLGDPSLAQAAVERILALPPGDEAALHADPVIFNIVERQLKPLLSPAGEAIDGWHSWFDALARTGASPAITNAYRDHAVEWSMNETLADPSIPDTLLTIATGDAAAATLLLEALPLFAETVIRSRGTTSDARAIPALLCSAEILGLSDHLSRTDLTTLLEIVESLLSHGLDAVDYRGLLHGGLIPAWKTVASPHHAPWIADVLASIWEYPSPDQESRAAFLTTVQSTLLPIARGLSLETAIALEDLLDSLGTPTTLRPHVVDAGEQQWTALADRRVFVYSLRETSAKRAVRWMEERQPAASFYLATDVHPSKQTLDNAKNADILVIVTSAAKHAATIAIEQARRNDAQVRYPPGTGWSGIVSSVRDCLV